MESKEYGFFEAPPGGEWFIAYGCEALSLRASVSFPDAEVDWADVKVGAFVTAAVFETGSFCSHLSRHDRVCTEPQGHWH